MNANIAGRCSLRSPAANLQASAVRNSNLARFEAMAKKKAKSDAAEPKFETAMSELETIVRKLEQGGESLDEALDSYATAIKLLKSCHQRLEQAERRVELLSGVDAQGNSVATPLEDAAESLDAKQATRSARRSSPPTANESSADDTDVDSGSELF